MDTPAPLESGQARRLVYPVPADQLSERAAVAAMSQINIYQDNSNGATAVHNLS